MDRSLAFCGNDCGECRAFIAQRENNDQLRREVAEKLKTSSRLKIQPQEVDCDSCLNVDGRHNNYCITCEFRLCGVERNLGNCAFFIVYACEKFAKFHE